MNSVSPVDVTSILRRARIHSRTEKHATCVATCHSVLPRYGFELYVGLQFHVQSVNSSRRTILKMLS